MQNATILNVFPGASDKNRLVLARATTICGHEHLVLRQETHSPDVGWFVQSFVAIEPDQAAALKMTLAPNALNPSVLNRSNAVANSQTDRVAPSARKPSARNSRPAGSDPVILQFDEAS